VNIIFYYDYKLIKWPTSRNLLPFDLYIGWSGYMTLHNAQNGATRFAGEEELEGVTQALS